MGKRIISLYTLYIILSSSSFLSYNVPMRGSSKGFSLIELMVVVAIIAILASIGMVVYGNVQKSARLAKRVGDLKGIETALELYRSDNEKYPIASSWRSECANGGSLAPDDVIPGLVPKYVRTFPSDPRMDKPNNTSCYMYISKSDGSGFKLVNFQIAEFTAADYLRQRGLVDPARDGGSDPCKVDGESPEAWGFYTYNACSL